MPVSELNGVEVLKSGTIICAIKLWHILWQVLVVY